MIRLLPFLLLLTSVAVFGQQKDAYIFSYFKNNGEDGLHLAFSEDGYKWTALNHDSSFLKPDAGQEKLMRDPCIILGPDNLYHMVWTTGWNEKGIGYANSVDLIHWSDQRYFEVMQHEPKARNCWAPEIFYDQKSKQYMIFWATTVEGKFAETQSEKESGYNHRIYYVTTKNFREFSEPDLLYDMDFNAIDATIIQHDQKYVMFVKDETIEPTPQKNIRLSTSGNLTGGYSVASPPITGNYWAEGPAVLKVDTGWIVYFDKYKEKKMGAVFSKDLQVWTDISLKIKFPEGTRHGSVLKISRDMLDALKSK
ncbi:MAG TPA: glycoside hydrolase family 43 protein [Chryseosolibacter sp.]